MATPLLAVPPIAFARTEVLVSFRLADDGPGLDEALAGSAFWDDGGTNLDESKGLRELLPHFRRLMNGRGNGHGTKTTWRRLFAKRDAINFILHGLVVRAARVADSAAPGRITSAEATLFPTGEGLLAFQFTWDATHLTSTLLAESLPTLRRAHGSAEQRFHPIWSFEPRDTRIMPSALEPLARALAAPERDGRMQLTDIVKKLLAPAVAVAVAPTDLAAIHTSIILASPPAPTATDAIDRALFHFVHAAPPGFVCPDDVHAHTRILNPRGNRRIAIAREGVTAMGWPPSDTATHDSDVQWARGRFHGVYRLLHMHVHAERLAISGLNDRAAEFAERLDDRTLLVRQGEIERLLIEVTRYTLSLTGEDCGGNGDHVAFFSALRDSHRIPQQRDELRAEIDELRALLRAVENRRSKRADDDEKAFQRRVSNIGFFAVPLTIALGVLGVNVADGEAQLLFGPLTSFGIALGCMAVGAAFFVVSHRRRRQQELDDGGGESERLAAANPNPERLERNRR